MQRYLRGRSPESHRILNDGRRLQTSIRRHRALGEEGFDDEYNEIRKARETLYAATKFSR